MFRAALAALASLVLVGSLSAQTTWTGNTSNSWNLASNWNSGIPNSSVDATIPSSATVFPSTYTGNPSCRSLTIQSGATLTLGTGFDLTVNDDLTLGGTLTVTSANSNITVVGDWTNNGTFSDGGATVTLSATGSLGGTSATTFENLTISGGVRTCGTGFVADADVEVQAGATLDLGSFTHSVGGNWNSSDVSATVTGTGTITFTGSGFLTTQANSVPNVAISGGTRSVSTSAITGDLSMSAGAIQILDFTALTVGGQLSLTGGTLGWDATFAGDDLIDVAGNVTITAADGNTGSDSVLHCGGDWSSSSAFSPASGLVRLDGAGAHAIGGASPTFPNLLLASGTTNIGSATVVGGDLTLVSGASIVSTASTDVNGAVVLGNVSSSWDLGTFTHTVAGGYASSGASATGSGTIEFDGSGPLLTGGGSIANVHISAGTRAVLNSTIAGNLSLTGSAVLEIGNDQTLTVQGAASLTGGTLQWYGTVVSGLEVLDINGSATITAAFGQGTSSSRLRVAGAWSSTSAFSPTAGRVELDGLGSTSIGGASPTFFDLTVSSGSRTLSGAGTLGGSLTVSSGATLSLSAPLAVAGSATINGTFALGSQTASVAGNWANDFFGSAVTALGGGVLTFTGDGSLLTGSVNTIPDVVVSGGTRSAFLTTIAGDLDVTGGTFELQDNITVTVTGALTLGPGGTLAFDGVTAGLETLVVTGAVSLSGSAGAMSTTAFLQCSSHFTSTGAYVPGSGTVRLGGGGAATVSAVSLANVSIDNGIKTFVTPCQVTGSLTVLSGAVLDTDAALDVDGSVTLGNNTSSWDLGGLTHKVAGNYTSSGASATGGDGTIEFDGPGTAGGGGGTIDNVLISAGTRTCNPTNLTINGDLELTGGALQIANDRTVAVLGNADLTGGSLSWFGTATGANEVLDVDGDVTVTAAYGGGSANARFRVGGNWSSTSAFLPTAGLVELDGGSTSTISGTLPSFPSLSIVSGPKTLIATADVAGDLTVSAGHSLTLSLADLDVTGNVTVSGTLSLGGGTATVGGSWTSNAGGASVVAPGSLVFTGTGSLTGGVNPLPDVTVTGGVRSVSSAAIVGDLDVTGGSFVLLDDSTVTVSQAASFAVGTTLGFNSGAPGLELLDVEGDVTILGASGANSVTTRIRCAGNWTSNAGFFPTLGEVTLDGLAGTKTVTGTGTHFPDLRVSVGTKQVTAATTLSGNLIVQDGATLDSDATLAVGGSVTLGNGTASWDISNLTHTVVANWTTTGGSAVGTGTIQFTGTGTTATSTGSIPNVVISGGVRSFNTTSVTADLDMSAGSLRILNDALVTVGDDLTLTGGVLEWTPTAVGLEDVLDVAGDVTLGAGLSSGLSSANMRLRVAGDYSAGAGFAPASGRVELDGGTTASASGTLSFPDLRVVSGSKTLTVPATLGGDLTVDSGATLDTDGALVVGGDVTLGNATAAWLAGALTHTIAGSYVSAGASATGGATLQLGSTGDLATGGGTVDTLVATGGVRSAQSLTVLGDLTVTGGTLEVQDNATLDIAGSLTFGAGTVLAFDDQTAGLETLDVGGDVSLQATDAGLTANSLIECAGSWSANGNFTPGAGTVRLDGVALTTLTGLSPDQTTAFFALELQNGMREATNDLTLDIDTLLVDASAELRLLGNRVVVPGSTITVDGRLDIDAGGELALGPTAVLIVSSVGELSLVGVAGDPASIAGEAGGGYSLLINGALEAYHFHFGGMGVNGVVINATATLAAAPLDLRAGSFDDPSSNPGSVLLNIARLAPTTFRYVDFDGVGVGAFNLTTLFGSPITFYNSDGDFDGESFDNDPGNLVGWTQNHTTLVSFTATGRTNQVSTAWQTSSEVDIVDYVLTRAPTVSGPFVTVDEQSATGPGTYAYLDTGLNPGVYVYRLMERLTHGSLRQLDEQSALVAGLDVLDTDLRVGVARSDALLRGAAPTPSSLASVSAPPPALHGDQNVVAMPGGTWADLQAALDAASFHDPVVLLAPGTYPAFTVRPGFTGTLRVLADGSGPVLIDTSAGPVRVLDLPAEVSVELADLQIGGPGTALSVQACAGLVLVDGGSLTSSAGVPAVDVAGSDRVVLQGSAIGGLSARSASSVSVARGELATLDVTGLSAVRTAGLLPVASVETGSRWHDLGGGAQPELTLPGLASAGASVPVLFQGEPDSPFLVFVALGLGWQATTDLPVLVDLAAGEWSPLGWLGPAGRVGVTVSLPGEVLGVPLALQMVNQDPATGRLRWSNLASLVVPGEGGVLRVEPAAVGAGADLPTGLSSPKPAMGH